MSEIYNVQNLSKIFYNGEKKLTVLLDINFKFYKRDFISIMGVSGAGKSTLLHILGSLDFPTSGKIYFQGQDISNFNELQLSIFRNKKIGFVFQFFHLLNSFNVAGNVALPMLIAGESNKISMKKAYEYLEMVGLESRSNYQVNKLSGGEKQRVAIARALINNPEVILLDEPTGNLDDESSKQIVGILKKLNEHGVSIIMVTHNKGLAQTAKKTLILEKGIIHEDINNGS